MMRQGKFRWLLICYLCVHTSGCMGWFIGDPHPYAYVTRMGDTDTIGRWTMEQTDAEQIWNGLGALNYRMDLTKNKDDAEKAIEWYLCVVRKIEEWPEDRIIPTESSLKRTTREFLRLAYSKAAHSAYNGFAASKELLLRLRPDERHPQFLRLWEDEVTRLRLEGSREGDAIKGG